MKKFILSGLIRSRELLTTRALASYNAFQKFKYIFTLWWDFSTSTDS